VNAHDAPTAMVAVADRGLALMTDMLGEDLVERITSRNTIAPTWQRLTTEVLFGQVWSGEALPLRLRSMITVAVLVPMTRPRELENHMRAAMVNGVTADELVEIVQHVGLYAGWPCAGEALTILRCVLDDSAATENASR
jgi:4-carboxymuconolactone decarboxylase